MPSPATLDIDALLAPIPGSDAAGNAKAYVQGVRERLAELRREERPEDFDDATRPAELKRADWATYVETARTALAAQSKDLRIACHLVEGATMLHGCAGLRDGLAVLRRLVSECWDRLLPEIDDGDLDGRASPLQNMLDDPDRGARFPVSVMAVPVFGAGDAAFGVAAWKRLRGDASPSAKEAFVKAMASTDGERLAAACDDLHAARQELEQLIKAIDAAMGAQGPGLGNLAAAVDECLRAVDQELPRFAPAHAAASADGASIEDGHAAGGALAASPDQAVAARNEAYVQLHRAADLLEKLEPHSPIPYLVKRAVDLGRLPFPQLIQQLIRDARVLDELNRELGLSVAAPAAAQSS